MGDMREKEYVVPDSCIVLIAFCESGAIKHDTSLYVHPRLGRRMAETEKCNKT